MTDTDVELETLPPDADTGDGDGDGDDDPLTMVGCSINGEDDIYRTASLTLGTGATDHAIARALLHAARAAAGLLSVGVAVEFDRLTHR